MKTAVYDTQGKELRQLELPEEVFGADFNSDLVHQVVFLWEFIVFLAS